MKRRFWTASEDAKLRELFKTKPAREIAIELNRTIRSVYQHCDRLSLSIRRDKNLVQFRKSEIKRLIEEGLSDELTAKQLGMTRKGVSRHRIRMGMPANDRNERYRQSVREKTKEQLAKAGLNSLAEGRAREFEKFSENAGWPGVSVRGAQIANLLYSRGPMSRRQITEALGMPWKGSRKSLNNPMVPGGSYMAELQRAGIVVRLKRAVQVLGKGRGYTHDLYMIAIGVEPCQKQA